MSMTQQEAQKLRDQLAQAAGKLNRAADVIEARNKTIAEKDEIIGQQDSRIRELELQLAQASQQAEATGKAVAEGSADLDKAKARIDGLLGKGPSPSE